MTTTTAERVRRAYRAGLEAAAKVCDDNADRCRAADDRETDQLRQRFLAGGEVASDDCAAAIRALATAEAAVVVKVGP
jgi:hypothetical protein